MIQTRRLGLSHIDNSIRNRKIILNIIRTEAPISRKEISDASMLSIATTKRLIEDLIAEGLVVEAGINKSTRGRKASLLKLNSSYCCAIGVNIIPHAIELVELSFTGDIIYQKSIEGIDLHRDVIISFVKSEIKKAIEIHRKRCSGKLLGIGIGVAGLINTSEGFVLYTPNMEGWDNVPLGPQLSDEFETDVIVDDTVRCMALAEKRYGVAKDLDNFIYVYIGRGVGSGMVLDGRIYRGKHGVAGEVGHMTIQYNGNQCNCGNRGCLEAHVSVEPILKEAGRVNSNGKRSIMPDGAEKLNRDLINLKEILSASENGDRLSGNIIDKAGEHIGTGIANLINIFDPGVIILGGEVVEAFEPLLMDKIRSVTMMKAIKAISSRTSIVQGRVSGMIASRGAATLLIEKYLQNSILNI